MRGDLYLTDSQQSIFHLFSIASLLRPPVPRKQESLNWQYNLLPVISKSGVVGEDVDAIEEVEPEKEEEEKIEIAVKLAE